MALIQEQGSLLLHCPEENGKERGLNSEDLLQEQGGTGPAQQISLCSPPTAHTGTARDRETTALHSLHSQLPPPTPSGNVTRQRKSPNPSSSRTRMESKLPMSHHSQGAISHNNHYPTFPLLSLPFLFSLCSIKIIFSWRAFWNSLHSINMTIPVQCCTILYPASTALSKQESCRWHFLCCKS